MRKGPVAESSSKAAHPVIPLSAHASRRHSPFSSLPMTAPLQGVVRILLVGQDRLVSKGLHALLGTYPDVEVIDSLSSLDELSYLIGRIPVDVILLDTSAGTSRLCCWLHALGKQGLACLVLTSQISRRDQHRFAAAGARGYLSTCENEAMLLSAVRRVAYGEPVFYPPEMFHQERSEEEPEPVAVFGNELKLRVNQRAIEEAIGYLQHDFSSSIDWGINEQLFQLLPHLHRSDREMSSASGLTDRQIRYYCSEILYPLVSTLSGAQVRSRAGALAYLLAWRILECIIEER